MRQIVGIVQLLATIASMFLVDRAGRRLLLLISGIVMSISLAALGAFFYMLEIYGSDVQLTLGWLPLASLLLFIIAYSSGYANVPFLIMGELFPAKFRYNTDFSRVNLKKKLNAYIFVYFAFQEYFRISCILFQFALHFYNHPELQRYEQDDGRVWNLLVLHVLVRRGSLLCLFLPSRDQG